MVQTSFLQLDGNEDGRETVGEVFLRAAKDSRGDTILGTPDPAECLNDMICER